MYKKFRIWLEEKESHRHVMHQLLSRLGLEDGTVKLRQIDPERLRSALESMDLDDEHLNNIFSWLKQAPDSRIIDLIKQIGVSEKGLGDEELQGQPAVLPAGQPKRPRNPMQQSGMENLPAQGTQ